MRKNRLALCSLLLSVAACGEKTQSAAPAVDVEIADFDQDTAPADVAPDMSADADTPDAPDDGDTADSPDATVEPEDASDDSVATDADASSDTGELPSPGTPPFGAGDLPGPYNVGFREIEATYAPRSVDESRTIPISLWYPTLAREGRVAFYADIFRRPEVLLDAPIADTGRALPVLLFSHGNSSFAEQSFFMTELFASHGWAVAAPDHVNNTAFDTDDFRAEVYLLRMEDVSATLDALYEDEEWSGDLSEDVVLTGHSFGGYTTLGAAGARFPIDELEELCEGGGEAPRGLCDLLTPRAIEAIRSGYLDPRIDVAVPQTPAGAFIWAAPELGEDGIDDIDVPTLLLTGELDATLPNEEEGTPIWEALDGPDDMRIDFLGAGHFTFSNMCDTLPGLIDGDGCGDGFLDPVRAQELINRYSLAFARAHLWAHDPSIEILSEPSPSELSISRKTSR